MFDSLLLTAVCLPNAMNFIEIPIPAHPSGFAVAVENAALQNEKYT